MNRLILGVLIALCAALVTTNRTAAQNLLANPGFEDPITSDGAPFVGFWEGFAGPSAVASRATIMPRNGAGHLSLLIDNANNSFAGAFQDVEGLVPGQLMNFSVWHKTTGVPYNLVSEMRIEWRKVGQAAEISRTPNLLPVPTLDYSPVSLAAPVPAGADTARVVYAIQSFTNGTLPDVGTVFVDDVSLRIVPEPSTIGLWGIAFISLTVTRRRR
jgi:hypothetical protein